MTWRRIAFKTLFERLLLVIFLALLVRTFVVSSYRMPASIMAPALVAGDIVLGYKVPFGIQVPFVQTKLFVRSPNRGDVVSIRFPGFSRRVYIRRVVAVAGDKVSIRDRQIFVNDTSVLQLQGKDTSAFTPVIIPAGEVFVVADSGDLTLAAALQTRLFSHVPIELIDAHILRIWSSSYWPEGAQLPTFRFDRFFAAVL